MTATRVGELLRSSRRADSLKFGVYCDTVREQLWSGRRANLSAKCKQNNYWMTSRRIWEKAQKLERRANYDRKKAREKSQTVARGCDGASPRRRVLGSHGRRMRQRRTRAKSIRSPKYLVWDAILACVGESTPLPRRCIWDEVASTRSNGLPSAEPRQRRLS